MSSEVKHPTLDKWGAEVHPAFGMIGASRVSVSSPGSTLFDSDIQHGHTVVLRVSQATRKRDLSHDWIHGGSRNIIEVEMSEAQWASFVSSMNTSGVPCTIRQTQNEIQVPGLPYEPRMRESTKEVHGAADKAFDKIKAALAAYEEKKTVGNLKDLRRVIEQATGNIDYVSEKLNEHVENVTQRMRADIEAMVTTKAAQLGLTAADIGNPLELPASGGGSE